MDSPGQSYDSLFKALCAQAALLSPEGTQVLAPFSFVSVLAETLLAIHFVGRLWRADGITSATGPSVRGIRFFLGAKGMRRGGQRASSAV